MINYSIVMRSVNANLFEINQAKGRINAAKANGEEPAADDLALVATERQNAFGIAQYAELMTIEKFAKHIATHGCVYSRADISAILYMAVDCMREQLLEGKKIRLGDLGDFSVTLTSRGAETADKFTAQNITGVNVVWDCGQEFKNLIADAEFNLVASRDAQAKVLKAIKAGEQVVDLSATASGGDGDDPDGGGSGSGTGGSGNGSGDSGNGSGSGDSGNGSGSGDSGSAEPAKYTMTFKFNDGSTQTAEYAAGASITYPSNTSGYQWPASKPSVMPAQNTSVTEVAVSGGGDDDENDI